MYTDKIKNVQTNRHDTQADIIEVFNSTSRYLDDLLNIDNLYFEGMVTQMYPMNCKRTKLILLIPKSSRVLDNHLLISNGLNLFHLKFMANAMVLILTFQFSVFWMATFLAPLLMVYTFLN